MSNISFAYFCIWFIHQCSLFMFRRFLIEFFLCFACYKSSLYNLDISLLLDIGLQEAFNSPEWYYFHTKQILIEITDIVSMSYSFFCFCWKLCVYHALLKKCFFWNVVMTLLYLNRSVKIFKSWLLNKSYKPQEATNIQEKKESCQNDECAN